MVDREYLTAHFTRHGDHLVAALRLTLDARLDDVWTALTAPERLPQWLAPGTVELRQGGRAQFAFADSGIAIDSTVSAIDPSRVLEYSWSGPGEPLRPVRWVLEAIGARTRLELTLSLPAGDDAARATAGWAAHLAMLAATLAGVATRFPFSTFQAGREAYAEQLTALTNEVPAEAA